MNAVTYTTDHWNKKGNREEKKKIYKIKKNNNLDFTLNFETIFSTNKLKPFCPVFQLVYYTV